VTPDTLDKACHVVIAPDGLRATLQIVPGADPEMVTPEVLEAFIAARGVSTSAIDARAVANLCERWKREPEAVAEAVVAEGVPPVHGVDGRFELAPQLAPATPEPSGEQGRGVDHYRRSAFIIVEQGQAIGTLHAHTEPQDGRDVRGEVLKGGAARPCATTFDDTVELGQDGVVVALRKGRLEISATRVRVDPVLEIAESVDFSTGNVKFPGDVSIGKGVRDCFEVEVGGNLEITELVEAAHVRAGGSVVLLRGMAGRGKGELSAGGDLDAKYLDGANVSVGNDLRVQRELTNCVTHVGRCVRSPACTVVGGELWMRFGGEVRALGGEAEAETLVRLGVDADLDAFARMLEELLPETAGRAARVQQQLAELTKPEHAELRANLEFDAMAERKRIPSIRAAIERVLAAYTRLENATLTVEKSIMPGVTLAIGSRAATVREPIRGPVTIAMDEHGTLVMRHGGTQTPLATKAKLHPAPGSADLDEMRRWLDHPLLAASERAA
jgi:uncharacterized protein (DUF342 family)